ncbi:MAG TPA: hypothetical protein VD932_02755 [Aquabacterium sp.]|nr:hypothetical protein [Aquabacterium sp.]
MIRFEDIKQHPHWPHDRYYLVDRSHEGSQTKLIEIVERMPDGDSIRMLAGHYTFDMGGPCEMCEALERFVQLANLGARL